MSERLRRGGRLLAFGDGDGARYAIALASLFAMPPYRLATRAAVTYGASAEMFATKVTATTGPTDVALGVYTDPEAPFVRAGFANAHGRAC